MLKNSATKKWLRLYKMMICGTIPTISNTDEDDNKELNKLISKIKLYKPAILLNQFTPPGVTITPEDCKNLIELEDTFNTDYEVDLTPWLELSISLDIDLVGINTDMELIQGIKNAKHRYMFIESALCSNISDYYNDSTFDKRVAVIVSDIHLRYFEDTLYGESSNIIQKFIYKNDVIIIRVADEKRLVDNSNEFEFRFTKIQKTASTKKYADIYTYSDIEFRIGSNNKHIKVGKIEYLSGLYNRHKIRKGKYVEFKSVRKPVFIFFHVLNEYKPFGLYEYIVSNFLRQVANKLPDNDRYFVIVDNKEAELFERLKYKQEPEYVTFLPEEKRDKIFCFSLTKKKTIRE